MRNRRGGSITQTALHPHIHIMSGKDLDGSGMRWFGERVGVHTEEQRTVDLASPAVLADRLTDCQDMVFIERFFQG